MGVRCAITTPVGRPSAIALVRLEADQPPELDRVIHGLRPGGVEPGGRAMVRLECAGGDEAVLVRPEPCMAWIMPHGSPAVLAALIAWLGSMGVSAVVAESSAIPPADPPAPREIDRLLRAAMGVACSDRAVDRLLGEPERWSNAGETLQTTPSIALDRELNRLLVPPLVVAIGAPNIGKSSFLNALAGRPLAVVADAPGTTRDHVGAMIDLDGVAVRWIDLPGVGPSVGEGDLVEGSGADGAGRPAVRSDAAGADAELESAAVARLGELIEQADLIVRCGDPRTGPLAIGRDRLSVTVCLRHDLDQSGRGAAGFDAALSVRTGRGVSSAVRVLRSALVSDEALHDSRPWRFWTALPPTEPHEPVDRDIARILRDRGRA